MKNDIDPSTCKIVQAVTKHWLANYTGFFDTIMNAVAEEVAPLVAAQVQANLAAQFCADGFKVRYESMLATLKFTEEFLAESCHSERGHLPRDFVQTLRWHVQCGIARGEGREPPPRPQNATVEGDIPF